MRVRNLLWLGGAFIAGALLSQSLLPDAEAQKKHDQWQYQCLMAENVAQVTARANKLGAQGWKMVTSAGHKSGETQWCFTRPMWKTVIVK